MATDKVLLEVLNNRFTGIVEEMGYIIHRASFTVFIKETWDFDSALVSTDGEIFCYPRNIGVTNMLGMRMDDAIRAVGDVQPGDVIVTNDPHRTRGMCTHLPDIMMFKPLFAGGRLLCFAWCFIHSSDVGGLVPGSISPTAFDKFQEGLTIPPMKLIKAGTLNQELLDMILANVRIKVRVEVRGRDVRLDFSGTDPQVRAAFNLPTYDKPNQWVVLGIVN